MIRLADNFPWYGFAARHIFKIHSVNDVLYSLVRLLRVVAVI